MIVCIYKYNEFESDRLERGYHHFIASDSKVKNNIGFVVGVWKMMVEQNFFGPSVQLKNLKITSSKQPRPWQLHMDAILELIPDERHIYWIYDYVGGSGKSVFAKWQISKRNAFYSTGGRHDRIFHAYRGECVVLFRQT